MLTCEDQESIQGEGVCVCVCVCVCVDEASDFLVAMVSDTPLHHAHECRHLAHKQSL